MTSGETLNEFLKKHGCDADAKAFTALLRTCHEGEIEDDDAAAAAGGLAPFVPQEPTTNPRMLA